MKYATLIVFLAGCASALHATANATYSAQLQECVQKSQTKEQSTECRKAVDQKWGLGSQDASTDGDAK